MRETDGREQEEYPSPLAKITDASGFSQVAPRLRAALEYRDQPGATIFEILNENIHLLQDAFVEALYAVFAAYGIGLTHKLTLRLKQTVLAVAGMHPDAERINLALAASPDLSGAFLELATQSAALRDLTNLHAMLHHSTCAERPSKPLPSPRDPAYQISLKGDMNHFYFCSRDESSQLPAAR